MATVTVYTADRMKDIENKSVVSGQVVGDNLILTKYDNSVVNAGNVRGPKGTNGAAGYTSIVVCSSTSRPTGSSRFNGLAIFETDTNKFLIWNGIRWDPPWNQPWGLMGMIQRTNDAGPVTGAEVSIAGMSFPFTAVANRRMKITFEGNTYATGGTDNITFLRIVEDTTSLATCNAWNTAPNFGTSLHGEAYWTPAAGAHTYYVRAGFQGAGQVMIMGRPDSPMSLVLEDMGPNGAPA
jgi:hypothetical protein